MTPDDARLPLPCAAADGEPSAPDLVALARLLRAHAPYDGRFALRIGGVYAICATRPTPQLLHTTHDPALCIVAQGASRRVAQIGLAESNMHKIAKAVEWLRANYAQPMNVEALAELVHMSPSSFHQHFKSITAMSPLQYQKVLRLQEARRLMASTMMDVGAACRTVGYASTSQFTREYGRYFGSAPTRDIARLREHALPAP